MKLYMITAKRRVKLSNPWHLLATGFGCGLFSWMPGTVGSLVAIPLWYLLILLPWPLYLCILILSIFFGVYFCHQTTRDIGVNDHGCIVWDEFVGMWITLIMLPVNNWQWVTIGFTLFRVLDIWKPWPIYWFDRKACGGVSIIIDDIIAGVMAAYILYYINYQLITNL